MRFEIKSNDDLKQEIINQLKNGVILVENEAILYDTDASNHPNYDFSVVNELDKSIIGILYISGFDKNNNFINNEVTINGIEPLEEGEYASGSGDFEIWVDGTPSSVDSKSNDYDGEPLYHGIKFNNDVFKEDSYFYITYIYYDNSKESLITNFADGTISSLLIGAYTRLFDGIYKNQDYSHNQQYIDSATGVELERIGDNLGITKYNATSSEGYVLTTNDGNEDLTITTSHIFATSGAVPIQFSSNIEVNISASESKTIYIISTDTGRYQNVGAGAVTKIYTDSTLVTEESDYTSTNPAYIDGQANSFNEGNDVESDEDYRSRILRALTSQITSRKDAIENAVSSLSSISFSKAQDWEENKNLPNGEFNVFVVGEDNKIITDNNIINDVDEVVNNYKPIGSTYSISRPHPVYIDMDMDVYIPTINWAEKTDIETEIETRIINFIGALELGTDFKQSTLIKEIMKVEELENIIFTDFNFTLYSYDPYELDDGYEIITAGVVADDYAEQFIQTTKNHREQIDYVSAQTTYTMSKTQITDDAEPVIYLGIQDSYGNWIRDPKYAIDFYDNTYTSTTIDLTATAGGYTLQNGDPLIFDYSYVKYIGLDGMRFFLEVSDNTVGFSFDVSICEDDAGYPKMSGSAIDPIITYNDYSITTDGTIEVDFMFGSGYVDLTSYDPRTKFWVVIHDIQVTGGTPTVALKQSSTGDVSSALGGIISYVYDSSGAPYWEDLATGFKNRYLNKRTFINYRSKDTFFDNERDIEANLFAYQPEVIVLKSGGITITSNSVVVD